MIYRNKKSGAVIEIPSELISPDWEDISGTAVTKEEKDNGNSVRKRKRSDSTGDKSDGTAAGVS
ncbi:MAG: hypothetical protein KBA55_12335 [Ruminococcus sp.]|nr:hypothetical protein [Ruminococcus sp.]